MTAHSRGPINDRAAGLLEAAEICRKVAAHYHDRAQAVPLNDIPLKNYLRGKGAVANECAEAILARAATVEQATRAEKGGEESPDMATESLARNWLKQPHRFPYTDEQLDMALAALRGTKERV